MNALAPIGGKTQHQPGTDNVQAIHVELSERDPKRGDCTPVHALGPWPLGEMLAEIAHRTGQHVRVVDLVEEYAQLDPDLLRFLGGDSFAPMPLEVVR